MTPKETQDLERLVDWRLAKWRHRSDYDDMRQEALIAAWQALEKTQDGPAARSTIITHAADYAALEWLRSTRSDAPHYGWRRSAPPLALVSVQELQEQRKGFAELHEDQGTEAREPAVDDFAPDVIERLINREEWVTALGEATPRQAAALRALYRDGKSQAAVALEMGCHWSAVSQLHARALTRRRARLARSLVEEGPDDSQ